MLLKDQAPTSVKTKTGKEIMVRNLKVEDDTGDVSVTLWREATTVSIDIGEYVLVKDSTLGYNDKASEYVVSVNNIEDIKVRSNICRASTVSLIAIFPYIVHDACIFHCIRSGLLYKPYIFERWWNWPVYKCY